MARLVTLIVALAGVTASTAARAQNEPNGPHPRIWLDEGTLATLRSQVDDPDSGAAKAIARCAVVRADPEYYADGVWRGFEIAAQVQMCALAYQITGNPEDAATALIYFEALIDDYERVGDGAGGDSVIEYDHGYVMRIFAPWLAIGYDWLHDAPGMTSDLRSRARARFRAWTDWYRADGYLHDTPGGNYHAGFAFGTTLIAIAQGGEGGDASAELWQFVRDQLWGVDMATVVEPGAVLDGGDWPEGWNYGPFSVVEYALAVRALNEQGLLLEDFDRWAGALILRQLVAQTPSGGEFVAGDAGSEQAIYQTVSSRTVFATMAGTAPARMRELARAYADEQGLEEEEHFFVFEALAEARTPTGTPLADSAPTWYYASGSRTLFARSSWSNDATWTVSQCAPQVIPDHQQYNAGNLVLSRGADNLVVDASPYGSFSTLTSNAPTVSSANLPDTYRPSQGNWGLPDVAFAWAHQTASGAIVSRCDYRGQYRFRGEAEPDLDYAIRDTVVLPHGAGSTSVVIDRIDTGDAARPLLLRFHTPGSLTLAGDVASATVGGSSLFIRRLSSNAGDPVVATSPVGDCYTGDRGKCINTRLPVDVYTLDVPAAAPVAVHVLDAAAASASAPDAEYIDGDGYFAAAFERDGARYAVIAADTPDGAASSLSYRVPAGGDRLHVVVDAPRDGGRADVTASSNGGDCEVTVTAASGGAYAAEPLTVMLSSDCSVSEDPATEPLQADNSDGTVGDGSGPLDDATGGCCDTGGEGSPLGALLLAGLVVAMVARRRVF